MYLIINIDQNSRWRLQLIVKLSYYLRNIEILIVELIWVRLEQLGLVWSWRLRLSEAKEQKNV